MEHLVEKCSLGHDAVLGLLDKIRRIPPLHEFIEVGLNMAKVLLVHIQNLGRPCNVRSLNSTSVRVQGRLNT